MNCTISFVMPVYNAETVLSATLDSIVAQDDGSFEIICVDDGSTDGSGDILHRYASEHPFIHVISQNNQGITAARNAALPHAVGTWICFIDNDDILAAQAVRTIHEYADESCDIVYFDYERFSDDAPDQAGNEVKGSEVLQANDIVKLQSDCINRFRDNHPLIPHSVLPTPWAKVYRREFLQQYGLTFRNEVTHEEDVVFNFEVLAHVRKAMRIAYTLYYYRWSVKSESHRYRPQISENVEHTLNAYEDIIGRLYPDRKDIAELYQYRVLWELLYCVYLGPMHIHNPRSYRQRRADFQELLRRERFKSALRNVSTFRFEPLQSVLSTLIKMRQFWLLNIIGKVVYNIR